MRLKTILLSAALSAASVLGAGCEEKHLCDANERFDRGVCIPGPVVADAAPATDAEGSDVKELPVFGTPCTKKDHSDCQGDVVDVCILREPATTGHCSAKDCNLKPSICPTGYICYDASTVQPGLPFLCIDPTKL